jgi:hypothetical protein
MIRELGVSILDAEVLAELDAAQATPLETAVAPTAEEALARELRELLAPALRGTPRWQRRTGLLALHDLRERYAPRPKAA